MRTQLPSIIPPPVAFAVLITVFAGINLLAVETDPGSASHGSASVALETLGGNRLAELAFLFNCGFALGYGAFAYFAGSRRRLARRALRLDP
jgi:hypothetical protein